jgi:predicted ATPase/serine/threonine protein kinase/uncharacterized protein HemY
MQGTLLANRYLLEEVVGAGGMSAVYRSTDTRTGATVAVKLLHAFLATNDRHVARLRREARVMASLSSPRIARVLDFDTHDHTPFLVMEYVAGLTLADVLLQRRVSIVEALGIALEVARALEAAHARGIVHRDLKPSNIKLVDGQAKVLDFGIASVAGDTTLTASGAYLGTPEYSAPEHLEGPGDGRSDIYALAIIMFEMLEGSPPFRAPTPLAVLYQHASKQPPPLAEHTPAAVQQIVLRCLAKGPDARYQTASELTEALLAALRSLPGGEGYTHGLVAVAAPKPEGAQSPGGDPHTPQRSDTLSIDTVPNNLPKERTSFIGRERELEHVARLLATSSLVTLSGIGGCGKSRLAREAAAQLRSQFTDGIWLVDLAPLADEALIPQAIAAALGVREDPRRPIMELVTTFISTKQVLLILDNCEHLIVGCAQVTQALLGACPLMAVLATSREALSAGGEVVWRVPSLTLPTPVEAIADADQTDFLMTFDAVHLFVERATTHTLDFTLTSANAAPVVALCQRLDGIPLALELVAARTVEHPPEVLATLVQEHFRLLLGGTAAALSREQVIRAALEWTYALLSEEEQALFRRIGVFAGGFSSEAVLAVCGEGESPGEVSRALRCLSDWYLVTTEHADPGLRYRMLEPLGQLAREKAQTAGEAATLRARHRDWFVALAQEAKSQLRGAAEARWLQRLDLDYSNLRAALAWSTNTAATQGLQVATALFIFWDIRGYYREARTGFEQLLQLADDAPLDLQAEALGDMGMLAWRQGDYSAARTHLEQSLGLRRTIGDPQGMSISLHGLGNIAYEQGDYAAARARFEESLSLRRQVGEPAEVASSLTNLANVLYRLADYPAARARFAESLALCEAVGHRSGMASASLGLGNLAYAEADLASARRHWEQSLALSRELGDTRRVAVLLANLGLIASSEQAYTVARSLFEESLAVRQEIGDRQGAAIAILNLAALALDQEDYEQAGSRYAESLTIRHELGDRQGVTNALEGLAGVALATNQPERATRLLAACAALRSAIGVVLPRPDQESFERQVAAARTALSDDTFTTVWAEGQMMPLESAVAMAVDAATA